MIWLDFVLVVVSDVLDELSRDKLVLSTATLRTHGHVAIETSSNARKAWAHRIAGRSGRSGRPSSIAPVAHRPSPIAPSTTDPSTHRPIDHRPPTIDH
ncbi:MAG: hypothetical protein ABI551_05830 [Polyangiaceae bacterium]